MKITAVIMCSGLSRRMGENKLLMDFKGRRLFEYIINTVSEIDFYKILVITPYKEICEYSGNLSVINNTENFKGISSSIKLGAENCGECDGIMFFTADQPFMTGHVIEKLIKCFNENNKIIVPTVNKVFKNPVIFPIRYKKDLLALSDDYGGKYIYTQFIDDVIFEEFNDATPFIDIDTAEDIKIYGGQN